MASVKRVQNLLSGFETVSHIVSVLLVVDAQIKEYLCHGKVSPGSDSSQVLFCSSFLPWLLKYVYSVMSNDRQIGSLLNCWWFVNYKKWVSELHWTVPIGSPWNYMFIMEMYKMDTVTVVCTVLKTTKFLIPVICFLFRKLGRRNPSTSDMYHWIRILYSMSRLLMSLSHDKYALTSEAQ